MKNPINNLSVIKPGVFCLILMLSLSVNAQNSPSRNAPSRNPSAQTRSTPEERAEMQTSMMKKELNLSAEQEAKVHKINLKYAKKGQAIMLTQESNTEKAPKMKAMNQEKDEELKTALTKEQFELFMKRREGMQERVKERRMENRERPL